MKTIHVKFDELTTMASEQNCLEHNTNFFNFEDSSTESNQTPSKEDLDDLFGPLYEEYHETRQPEVSTNSASPTTLNNKDIPSTSTTIIDDNDAPQIVSTSEEPTSPISNDLADESIQEDNDPLNMHEFYQLQRSTDKWKKAHPLEQVIGDPTKPVMTRSRPNTDAEIYMYALTVSTTEPKNIKEAMQDHSWIESMQDELYQFERLKVWELVERPTRRNIIGVKWLWKNKTDAENTIIRNKSRLVAKGYRQEEGTDSRNRLLY
ncbi:retrovirus-related pol polyprotein from transposon TNT 1-94 [Tanacetum coccineum]